MFIDATRVVKEGKQLHHMPVGFCMLRQHQAIGSNTCPVSDTVMAPPVDLELLAQVIKQVLAIKDTQENLS